MESVMLRDCIISNYKLAQKHLSLLTQSILLKEKLGVFLSNYVGPISSFEVHLSEGSNPCKLVL